MADIQMPQLGESVTEGTITKWFKQVGEHIAEDEVLFEVSTDKVDSEVPSPVSGYLAEIKVPEGDTVDVGTVLAVVSDAPAGDGDGRVTRRRSRATCRRAPPAPAAGGAAASAAPRLRTAPPPPPPAAPAPPRRLLLPAPAPAAPRASGPADVAGRAPTRRGLRHRRRQHHAARVRAVASPEPMSSRPYSRPARDPASPPPASHRRRHPRPRPRRAAAATVMPKPRSGTGDTVEPLNNIRRRTAEHMVMSKATSPHAYTIFEVDYEGVDRVRRAHRDDVARGRGIQPHLPAVHRAGGDRRLAGLPAHQRHGRRR